MASDGKYIISGGQDGCIKIFETKSQKEIYCFENIHHRIFFRLEKNNIK